MTYTLKAHKATKFTPMLLKPISLALLVCATEAVRLQMILTQEDSTGTDVTVEVSDPIQVGTTDCLMEIPDYITEPLCYDGMWIDSSELDSPDFWACGAKPGDLLYPVCNHETGHWEEVVPQTSTAEDIACGARPEELMDEYVVCNYDQMEW